MIYISQFIDKGLDVCINTTTNNENELLTVEVYTERFKEVINSFYLENGQKESILFTLTESSLCIEQSIFAVVHGFYSSSMESLRKVIELVVFGIHFDKNYVNYQSWLRGSSEFRFTEKLNTVYAFSEICNWGLPCVQTLKTDIIALFKILSEYTHSNPTRWEQGLRINWFVEYDKNKFDIWYNNLLLTIKYATTIITVYSPKILNDACSKIIEPSVLQDILSQIV